MIETAETAETAKLYIRSRGWLAYMYKKRGVSSCLPSHDIHGNHV